MQGFPAEKGPKPTSLDNSSEEHRSQRFYDTVSLHEYSLLDAFQDDFDMTYPAAPTAHVGICYDALARSMGTDRVELFVSMFQGDKFAFQDQNV